MVDVTTTTKWPHQVNGKDNNGGGGGGGRRGAVTMTTHPVSPSG